MKKLNPWVLLLPLLNILCLLFIRPLIVQYFTLSVFLKIVYVILVFGSPIFIALPVALLLLPFGDMGNMELNKREKFTYRFSRAYISVNLILFFSLGVLMFSKMVLLHDPFPKVPYAQITDKAKDCSDLREGNFKDRHCWIKRENEMETTYNKDKSDSIQYRLTWLSDYEYRLVKLQGEGTLEDTIDMKVTNNTPDYYEGFTRLGIYAVYKRVDKVK